MTVLDYRSGIDERTNKPRRFIGNWLGWAIYLGMSWTWCIGMFLPVLLIRDYGGWSWWVFAIPNVVGAAAMGWILDDQSSERMSTHHHSAIIAFSFITAAFQIFFAFWVFNGLKVGEGLGWLMLALAGLFCWGFGSDFLSRVIAVLVLLFSVQRAIALGHHAMLDASLVPGAAFPLALLGLAPVCIFGFGLCPYLDATFHRARQRALPASRGRAAFGVGFGVFFLAMIYFTREYSWVVIQFMRSSLHLRAAIAVLGTYWLVQLAFTTGLHWQVMAWWQVVLTILVGGALGYGIRFIHYPRMDSGELIYRLFMAFYGLIFPAYVWLCMIPTWRNPAKPSSRSLAVFAGSILLASPFYWLGFIDGRMGWLGVGLGIVLLARLAIRRPVPLRRSEA